MAKVTAKPYKNTGIKYLSPEWEKARKHLGIGGSEAASIIGFNPYSSAFAVYWNKVSEDVEERHISEAMRQGSDLEDYVAKRFCEATGKEVKRNSNMLQSKEYPFMLADVDRFIVGENAILECKCSLNRDLYSYENAANIPAYHLVQCLHYMAVVGADKAYLATLVYGKDFHIVEINRQDFESDIKALIETEKRFWEENVLKKLPPLPDGTESSTQAIARQFPLASDETEKVDLSKYSSQLRHLSELKQEIAKLTDEKTGIENLIKQTLGEAPIGECEGYKISWKNRESTRLDSKALKADLPDIYAKYAKTSTTRTFLFSEIQE